MERTARRLFFALAVLSFLVALPLVYGYAGGWRIAGRGLRVIPRGALVIMTDPAGARVTINGREYPDRTPLRAPALPAGRYRIQLDRTGYNPWNKRLVIEPGRATLALSVPLFRRSPRVETLGPEPLEASLGPGGRVLLVRRTDGLFVLRLRERTLERVGEAEGWDEVVWAEDGRRALLLENDRVRLLAVGSPSRVRVLPLAKAATFDPLDPDGMLLAGNRGIERYSPQSQTRIPLTNEPAVDFAAAGRTLIWRTANGTLRIATRAATGAVSSRVLDLPPADGHLGIILKGSRIVVFGGGALAELSLRGSRVLLDVANTQVPSVSPDGAWLLTHNTSEVWAVRLADGARELLARSASPVTGTAFVARGQAAAIAAGGVVRAAELDGRDTRNAPVLFRKATALIGTDGSGRLIVEGPADTGSGALSALTVN